MSRHFATDGVEGYGEIVWRRVQSGSTARRYLLTVGNKPVGEVWCSTFDNWTAIAYAPAEDLLGLRMVKGFRTRWAATDYILDVGFRKPEEREGS